MRGDKVSLRRWGSILLVPGIILNFFIQLRVDMARKPPYGQLSQLSPATTPQFFALAVLPRFAASKSFFLNLTLPGVTSTISSSPI